MSYSDEENFDDIYGGDEPLNVSQLKDEDKQVKGTENESAPDVLPKEDIPHRVEAGENNSASNTSQLDQLAALQALSSNLNQLQQSASGLMSNTTSSNSTNTSNVNALPQMPQMPQMTGMPDMSQLQQLQQTMSQLHQQAADSSIVKADLSRDINKMFIGGLNWETTEDNLRDYFSKYGTVTEVKIMRDGNTGRSRGFGFLSFENASSVDEVVKTQHILDGKVIDPKRAIPREEQDKTGKIFVGGIGPDVRPKEFEEFFSQWGSIIDAQLMLDKDTGRSRGFGFITYDTPDAVDRVCQNKFIEFKGKKIEIKRAEPRQIQKQKAQQQQNQFQMYQNPMMSGFNSMFNPQAMADYYTKMQEYYQQMQQQTGMDYSQMYQQQMQQMMSMMGGASAPPATPPSNTTTTTSSNDESNSVPTIGDDPINKDIKSLPTEPAEHRERDRERSPDSRRGGRAYRDRRDDYDRRDRDGYRRGSSFRGNRGRDDRRGGYSGSRRGYHPYSR